MATFRIEHMAPLPNGELAIAWSDGEESYHPAFELRCACRCASCVDELTGRQLLDARDVPRDVRPNSVHPVGNYGVSIAWSDGHQTGIYTFAHLREAAGLPSG